MTSSLKHSISKQRQLLADMIAPKLEGIAEACSHHWPNREGLNNTLTQRVSELPYCSYLYALGTDAIQISDNINTNSHFPEHFGRDRSQRPYLNNVYPAVDYWLSEAYISLLSNRPSITAIQLIRRNGKVVGLLGCDFDLRDLPLSQQLYDEPEQWRQIKGDPSIRGMLFLQERATSIIDQHIDEVTPLLTELICKHGVFHSKLFFSSSRASLWLMNDPYRYRMLDIEALMDPDICFAYPLHDYPTNAVVPEHKISEIYESFKRLRFADQTVYLRSGSLNIFNGLVGLNFSCDGSHYLPWDEFLDPTNPFWSGDIQSTSRPA
ncbi:MAG: PDC sensor domain-containing protein [Candidatus Sedimenticola sp. (ex Thyasira tokunagai)]